MNLMIIDHAVFVMTCFLSLTDPDLHLSDLHFKHTFSFLDSSVTK